MANEDAVLKKALKRGSASKIGKGIFTVRRIVNWGDCDPAGMVYTPRVLDFACETVEAWLRDRLKRSWWQGLTSGKGFGLPTVNAVCDFTDILRPDERIELYLYIREVGRSSIVFEVEGIAKGGRHAFRVRLVSCAMEMITYRAAPIPAGLRKRLEAYQRCCG